jgi:hypothetical protein
MCYTLESLHKTVDTNAIRKICSAAKKAKKEKDARKADDLLSTVLSSGKDANKVVTRERQLELA